MITAATWVPRGASARHPSKYEVDEEELARISKLAKLKLDDAREDLDDAQKEAEGSGDESSSDDDDEGIKISQSNGCVLPK
jgi:periodic tryptophan protein 1